MRAPLGWIAEYVDLPEGLSGRELADALVRIGLEVERADSASDGLSGPIVIGRVLEFSAEPQKNGKTIRWCQVDVGAAHNDGEQPRGIVCGADNFAVGDLVVVALPGAVLPGGFAIAARKTYGHVSDGMICSVRELGIGDDHAGILILPAESAQPGDDALDALGLREAVLDIAVTPDRGYCLSIRGLAREAALALQVPFTDVTVSAPAANDAGYPARVEDRACSMFSLRSLTGLDPHARTPDYIAARLRACGMRPISLAVDVTNYVMLETGQPLHAYDQLTLQGPIVVRSARTGERIVTLDDVTRTLDPADLVIADDSGPIGLAGVMGGASTEITASSTELVLEAACFDPATISRAVRRHKLPSEAAKRFERGVDPRISASALQRVVDLLVRHGGAQVRDAVTVVGAPPASTQIVMPVSLPSSLSGLQIEPQTVLSTLAAVGCDTDFDADSATVHVQVPSWRPDLTDPADLVEEVVRVVGYDKVPAALPTPPPGRGLSAAQKLRRNVSRALAAAGYTEVLSYPFVSPTIHDTFGLAVDDARRRAVRLVNPLSDTEPELRTSLLPGLLTMLARNIGRGERDLAIYETGLVFLPPAQLPVLPRPAVTQRPTDEQLRQLFDGVAPQPRHAAVVLSGEVERRGWWGSGRQAGWADAIEAARVIAAAARVQVQVLAADHAPWHPGRCAQIMLDGVGIGYAGELHPRVLTALGLPARTCAMEIDLDAFTAPPPVVAPVLADLPAVLIDVSLVVEESVSAAELSETVRESAGEFLDGVRLFDLYADSERLGEGKKSMTFALRFRAADRTLTAAEANDARDAVVAAAAQRFGARLRD